MQESVPKYVEESKKVDSGSTASLPNLGTLKDTVRFIFVLYLIDSKVVSLTLFIQLAVMSSACAIPSLVLKLTLTCLDACLCTIANVKD